MTQGIINKKREDKMKFNRNTITATGKSNADKNYSVVSKPFYEKKTL